MFDNDGIENLIARGVEMALQREKERAKHGRSDTGSGDPRLGEIVRRYREREGLTQRDLGDNAGLHSTTIGKIESGDRGMSLDTFARIAGGFSPDQTFNFAVDVIDLIISDHLDD